MNLHLKSRFILQPLRKVKYERGDEGQYVNIGLFDAGGGVEEGGAGRSADAPHLGDAVKVSAYLNLIQVQQREFCLVIFTVVCFGTV